MKTWKNLLVVLLMPAWVQAQPQDGHGRSTTPAPETGSESAASESGVKPAGSETLVLRRGTPFCMFITRTVSTDTARSGERVTFRVGDEISVNGLTIVEPGTEVSAMVNVRRPGRPNRDGKLSFVFDALPLVNGVAAPIRLVQYPDLDNDWAFWRWVFTPLAKGDPATQDQRDCLRAEIKRDIVLDKAVVTKLQSPLAGWKNRVRNMVSDSLANLDKLEKAGRLSHPSNFEAADELMEFDFASGDESQIGACRHCFSPLARPSHNAYRTGDREITVFFLQPDGVYVLYSNESAKLRDYKATGHRVLSGSFSTILALVDWELILLEHSPSGCRIVRLDTAHYPRKVLDSMDCKNVTDSPQRSFLLRSAQLRGDFYVGDIPSQTSQKRDLVTASLAASATGSGFQVIPVPPGQLYSRFDPTWEDERHIVYLRKPGQ